MDSDNILAVNVPNAISIAIMGAVGAVIFGMARKALMSKMGSQKPVPGSPA